MRFLEQFIVTHGSMVVDFGEVGSPILVDCIFCAEQLKIFQIMMYSVLAQVV